MRLFIAEKPSLAKAIAEGLPQPHKRDGDCIRCGDNDVVAWCVGHIMELVPPEEYDPIYKNWELGTLPIIPEAWQLQVSNDKLYNKIEKLIKQADIIVNAGDPDREGQLLVDEVIESVGTNAPIKRVLINDLNLAPVKKAISSLTDNSKYKGLSDSALARSRADWLYGINMTRLYTVLGKAGGYASVLSVGRVQTPLLGLIVRRDLEIENFKPKPYYTITTLINAEKGQFKATWKAGEQSENYLDDDGRLISKEHAQAIEKALTNQPGLMNDVDVKKKKTNPPLVFALKDIQMLASTKLDLSPDKTLEVVQSLYETHKIVTYPRSDCSYLPEGHTEDIPDVLAAITNHIPELSSVIDGVDTSLRSPVWNDKKVTAHHGIIPTPKTGNVNLSDIEKAVYELIAFRYLLQFYPVHEYQQTKLTLEVNNEILTASGRTILKNGWKGVDKNSSDDKKKNEEDENLSLPVVKKGDAINVHSVTVSDKKTTPPKPFTDATLLAAMSGIARFVSNEKVKQLLKESDGIGTPATQGNIIKTLFDRNFITKKGKSILSTQVARTLIKILPQVSTIPDMTAYWEASMNKIEANEVQLDSFLNGVESSLTNLVKQGKELGKLTIPGYKVHSCPSCKTGTLNRIPGQEGYFWGCSNHPECKQTYQDAKGQPLFKPKAKRKPGLKSKSKLKARRKAG